MIRVEIGDEIKPGVWAYSVTGFSLVGTSRQPLLDACRKIKLTGEALDDQQIALYRRGKVAMSCALGVGAGLTVHEAGPRFAKWKPRDPSTWEAR